MTRDAAADGPAPGDGGRRGRTGIHGRRFLMGGAARWFVGMQKEIDAGAILLELYKDLPCVRKIGYDIDETTGRILVRVIIDADKGDDEFYDNSMVAVRKARECEDRIVAGMGDKYEVVPIVTDPYGGGLAHFRTMTAVIDR